MVHEFRGEDSNLLLIIQSDPGYQLPHPGYAQSTSGWFGNIRSIMSRVRFTERDLREAIAAARSWTDTLRRLGYQPRGGNSRTVKKYAERFGISTDHFDPDSVRTAALQQGRIPLAEILVEGSTYSRTHLKDRLYQSGLKQPRCELCGQDERWRGARMAMILDHVNGVPDDNRLENLRIICPNRAATLETHCGRKNRASRKRLQPRSCRHCGKHFMPKYARHHYCSRQCGQKWDRTRVKESGARKVERPPHAQLVEEVEQHGYSGVGRRYGVSDTAVRKWLRAYEDEKAA